MNTMLTLTPRQRAAYLLRDLPRDGETATVRKAAGMALDTLATEFPDSNEVDYAPLARAMGSRATEAVKVDLYTSALQHIADGASGSGAALAAFALKHVTRAEPTQAGLKMARNSLDHLAGHQEVGSNASLDSTKKGLAWRYYNLNDYRVSREILASAAQGQNPEETAAAMLEELGQCKHGDQLVDGLAKKLAGQLQRTGDAAVQRTYRIARGIMAKTDRPAIVLREFAEAAPRTTNEVIRVLDSALDGFQEMALEDFRRGLGWYSEMLRKEEVPAWRLLRLGENASPLNFGEKSMRLALRYARSPESASPTSLVACTADMMRAHTEYFPSSNSTDIFMAAFGDGKLRKGLPDSWEESFELLTHLADGAPRYGQGEWRVKTYGILDGLSRYQGTRPLLKTLELVGSRTRDGGAAHFSNDRFVRMLGWGAERATRAEDRQVLQEAAQLASARGAQAATRVLAAALKNEV